MQTAIAEFLRGRAHSLRVLVAGDVMVDRYVVGEVDRISPEAPVPVLRQTRQYSRAGGAANVAANLAGLGLHASLVGYVGEDEPAEALRAELRGAEIGTSGLVPVNAPTTLKTRIVSRTQQLVRFDLEAGPETVASESAVRLREQALGEAEKADAIVLSDYGKGVLSPELCRDLVEAGRRRRIPVLVDPKGRDFQRYAGATTVCPNAAELALATGVAPADTPALFAAGRAMVRALSLEFLTVTLSERGIQVLGRDEGVDLHSPALAREVFDVSGAGDTVIAALAAGVAGGLSLDAALHLANLAAGTVVAKLGTVPVQRGEVLSQLGEIAHFDSARKAVAQEEAIRQVRQWQDKGETIVFTNGCFDLLHVGHISLLESSRRLGSKLVVGVNTDASVARLKGPLRPVVGEQERCRVLAALAAVDLVVLFGEATPLELIRAIRPSVLVKGSEYTTDRVVGAPEVLASGGRVELLPMLAGYSTTALVRRVRADGQR